MNSYSGSCHCAAVTFRIDAITTCNCSLCARKNTVMARVHENEITILTGEDALSTYEWNTRRAKHYFCSRCGIYTFHRKRSEPDHFGVNVFCLENLDVSTTPVRATDGGGLSVDAAHARNEWRGPRETG